MLEINYKQDSTIQTVHYNSPADFMANERLETPDLEDYYQITKVTDSGKPIELSDKTIGGLFTKFEKDGL